MEKLISYILKFVLGKPLAYSDRLRVAALTALAIYLERSAYMGDAVIYSTTALGVALILGLSHRDAPAGTTTLLPGQKP